MSGWVVEKPVPPAKIGGRWVTRYWCRTDTGRSYWGPLEDAVVFETEEATVAALRARFGPAWSHRYKGPRPAQRVEVAAGE